MSNVKKQTRVLVQRRLDQIMAAEYESVSETIVGKVKTYLSGLQEERSISSVLSYRAAPKWREVNLAPLEETFKEVSFDYAPTSMKASLPTGKYDIIFVPLYGFTAGNYRLGHGSGWYDSFLTSQPQAHTIGVGLEVCRVNFTPEAHDIPLSMIITESKVGKR